MKLEIAPPAPTIMPAGVEVYVKAALKFETVAEPFDKQVAGVTFTVGTAGIGNWQPMVKALDVDEQLLPLVAVIV